MSLNNPGLRQYSKKVYDPTVMANSNDPSKMLSDVAKSEQQNYNDTYRPLNESMVADVNSTKLVDIAKTKTAPAYAAAEARTQRNGLRYGGGATALDKAVQVEDSNISRTTTADHAVNTARFDQYERNTGLRNELINTSRGISSQATDGLGIAAQLQSSRQNANDQAKAQNSAGKTQLLGSLAGMALMALI